ncbi:T9SS type A sorting domain-containing protein [Reichenbachiella versicolor]|uniref:T9SS type A sorting domain-containing protein n=1 Tax=Reichenbachiella versicolor TaxID=1821036 RepID=UPI000D6E447C|nr:T9SS type A sorting domain-containing protein [Reichenbachiella versicolor]
MKILNSTELRNNIALIAMVYLILSAWLMQSANAASTDPCDAAFTYTIDKTSTGNWIYTFSTDCDKSNIYWTFNHATIGRQDLGYGKEFQHVFSEAGDWNVALFIDGGPFKDVQTISAPDPSECFINASDLGFHSSSSPSPSESALFHYYVTAPSSVINPKYTFDTGDGTVYTSLLDSHDHLAPIFHSYPVEGTFNACFSITDDAGFSCTVCEEVDVVAKTCTSSFDYETNDSDPFLYKFTAQDIDSDLKYTWRVDGEIVSSNSIMDYKFPKTGTYDLEMFSLNETTGDLCVSTESVYVVGCNTGFSYTIDKSSTDNWIYTFTANCTESKIYNWFFASEDGSSIEALYGQEVKHVFAKGGNWDVSLSLDRRTREEQIVTVPNPKECSFIVSYVDLSFVSSPEGELKGNYIHFNLAVPPNDKAMQYSLDLGDGRIYTDEQLKNSTGQLHNIFIPYREDGVFTACFSATNNNDFSCELCNDVEVVAEPCGTLFNYSQDEHNSLKYTFIADKPKDIDSSTTPFLYEKRYSFIWRVNGETITNTDSSFEYEFPSAGSWKVEMFMFNENTGELCTASETIEIKPEGNLYIQGELFADLVPIDGGKIILYKLKNDKWERVHEELVSNGEFKFKGLAKGKYLIHARGDEFIHQAFIPTYFVNGIGWQDAYEIDLTGSAEDIKITLIRSQNEIEGQGKLAGRIILTDLTNINDTEAVVILKDRQSQRAVKWTVSNQDHDFSFDELPFGSYQVTLEMPSHSVTKNFDITESQQSIEDIQLKPSDVLGVDETILTTMEVYPTVITDRLFISNSGYAGEQFELELVNILGNTTLKEKLRLNRQETVSLPLPAMEPGVYFLKTKNQEGKAVTIKLIKQ